MSSNHGRSALSLFGFMHEFVGESSNPSIAMMLLMSTRETGQILYRIYCNHIVEVVRCIESSV